MFVLYLKILIVVPYMCLPLLYVEISMQKLVVKDDVFDILKQAAQDVGVKLPSQCEWYLIHRN